MERFLQNRRLKVRADAHCSPTAWRQPMKSILDPSFRYTSSIQTDIRKTFARVRRERRSVPQQGAPAAAPERQKVVALRRG
jgi:hypothetical protein